MPLSSASTIDEIIAAYVDNAGYEENASVSQAKAFVTACRILLLKMPAEAGQGQANLRLSPELVQAELEQARRYIALAGESQVVHPSMENFRGTVLNGETWTTGQGGAL